MMSAPAKQPVKLTSCTPMFVLGPMIESVTRTPGAAGLMMLLHMRKQSDTPSRRTPCAPEVSIRFSVMFTSVALNTKMALSIELCWIVIVDAAAPEELSWIDAFALKLKQLLWISEL